LHTVAKAPKSGTRRSPGPEGAPDGGLVDEVVRALEDDLDWRDRHAYLVGLEYSITAVTCNSS
jgi:hypothetical protein